SVAFRVANPAPDLAIIRDYVRYVAALNDRIVHAHRGLDGFAPHVDSVGESFYGVNSASSIPRVEGSVRSPSSKLDYEIHQRLRAVNICLDFRIRMPGKAYIH